MCLYLCTLRLSHNVSWRLYFNLCKMKYFIFGIINFLPCWSISFWNPSYTCYFVTNIRWIFLNIKTLRCFINWTVEEWFKVTSVALFFYTEGNSLFNKMNAIKRRDWVCQYYWALGIIFCSRKKRTGRATKNEIWSTNKSFGMSHNLGMQTHGPVFRRVCFLVFLEIEGSRKSIA